MEAKAEGGAPDQARVALVSQRLTSADWHLRRWGYLSEVVYTWLGTISLGVAGFATYSHGLTRGWSPGVVLGFASVGLSVFCALVGWWQARAIRRLGRRCGLAAASLEPGGPIPSDFLSALPSLAEIETGLRARQRTAWLGTLFAILGLQAMVGLLVTKVLVASGGFSPAPGVPLDVFTLLAVSNAALSHVVGGGTASLQLSMLPAAPAVLEDPFLGWGRQ